MIKNFFYEYIQKDIENDNGIHELRTYVIYKGYYFQIIGKIGNIIVENRDLCVDIVSENHFRTYISIGNKSIYNSSKVEEILKEKPYYKDMLRAIRQEKLKHIL